jgi:hypothetical protein
MKEELHPLQIEAWKRMNSTRKHALTRQANAMVRSAVRARIARRNPELTNTEIDHEVSRFIIRSRT